MKRPEIVQQIRNTLRTTVPDATTILYGSEARGDASPDSDIDLIIIIDKEKISLAEEQAVTTPLYEIELRTGVLISARVIPKKLWENPPFNTPFHINVINDGIVI